MVQQDAAVDGGILITKHATAFLAIGKTGTGPKWLADSIWGANLLNRIKVECRTSSNNLCVTTMPGLLGWEATTLLKKGNGAGRATIGKFVTFGPFVKLTGMNVLITGETRTVYKWLEQKDTNGTITIVRY